MFPPTAPAAFHQLDAFKVLEPLEMPNRVPQVHPGISARERGWTHVRFVQPGKDSHAKRMGRSFRCAPSYGLDRV